MLRSSAGDARSPSRGGLPRRGRLTCGLILAAAVLLLQIVAARPAVAAAGTVWRWPLEPTPVILAGFAAPDDPYGAGSRGVDLAAAVGQPVLAASAGSVAFAGLVAGRPVVTVRHETVVTTYEPVVARVRVGQAVTGGQELGTVPALPRLCAMATCLHWGAYLPGSVPRRYLDPLLLVGAGPVRLLPDGPARPSRLTDPGPPIRPGILSAASGVGAADGRSAQPDHRDQSRAPGPAARSGTDRAGTTSPDRTAHRVEMVAVVATVASGAALLAPFVVGGAGAAGRRAPGRPRAPRRRR